MILKKSNIIDIQIGQNISDFDVNLVDFLFIESSVGNSITNGEISKICQYLDENGKIPNFTHSYQNINEDQSEFFIESIRNYISEDSLIAIELNIDDNFNRDKFINFLESIIKEFNIKPYLKISIYDENINNLEFLKDFPLWLKYYKDYKILNDFKDINFNIKLKNWNKAEIIQYTSRGKLRNYNEIFNFSKII